MKEEQINPRRTFLKKVALLWAALTIRPALKALSQISFKFKSKGRPLKRILVLWYSQTGHTRRIGQLMAHVYQEMNFQVTASEIREFNPEKVGQYDVIIIGTPVFYYDTPLYVKEWIGKAAHMTGIPVASFVTYGGPEGDQHNAASNILKLSATQGGIPIGLNTYINMAAFPLSWSSVGVQDHRHLPNEETFEKVRNYARELIERVRKEEIYEVDKKLTLRRMSTTFDLRFWTKLAVKNHSIDKEKCIACGTCLKKCPVKAIDLEAPSVDTKKCVLCFGCINNCPAEAIVMEYKGDRLYGFKEFLKRNNIVIKEPRELQS